MTFLLSYLVVKSCDLLLKLEWLPLHAFLDIVSLRASHSAALQRLHKAEMLKVDIEILGSLYGRRKP